MKSHYHMVGERNGFTLAETMISLLIMSIILMVIWMVTASLYQFPDHSTVTEFYLYLDSVENQNYKLTQCRQQQLNLIKGRKRYVIRLTRNKLVMSTNHGGYIPLLAHVKSVDWMYHGYLLKHHVTMENGREFDGRSYINEK